MKIAVVIPTYKAKKTIIDVIQQIPEIVDKIYVVDDKCPDESGRFVETNCNDPRTQVIYHSKNKGVGGATMSGYKQAIIDCIDIIVKIDSDGQMDPALLPKFIRPIINGEADYTKGNRFYDLTNLLKMPKLRILGNTGLSFLTKFSSGYWKIFDPTNGYTAIHSTALKQIDLESISNRFFFESDLLFRLYLVRAVVIDIPMHAKYEDEESNLKISTAFFEFFAKNIKNTSKRIIYTYFLRDFNIASLELLLGIPLFLFGTFFGLYKWISNHGETLTTSGEVMLAALPIILGVQFILAFLNFDSQNSPTKPISKTNDL